MKVLGYTDEITACDCCGKSNLCGTFAVEVETGVQHYGSVCVNKVFGTKVGTQIKAEAKRISEITAGTWEQAISKYSRGYFCGFTAYMGDKPAWNNSAAQMAAVTSIRSARTGHVVRERAA